MALEWKSLGLSTVRLPTIAVRVAGWQPVLILQEEEDIPGLCRHLNWGAFK